MDRSSLDRLRDSLRSNPGSNNPVLRRFTDGIRKREVFWAALAFFFAVQLFNKDEPTALNIPDLARCDQIRETAEVHARILDHVLSGGQLVYGQRTVACKVRS